MVTSYLESKSSLALHPVSDPEEEPRRELLLCRGLRDGEGPVLAPGSAEVAFADLRRDLRHLARLLLASLGEDQPIGP